MSNNHYVIERLPNLYLAAHEVAKWNKEFWNDPLNYSAKQEKAMAQEELDEMFAAMVTWNNIEIMDWAMDVIFVVLWSLYKAGFTPLQIENSWKEVVRSNFTKFPVTKDSNGKIKKSENYEKPNLDFLIN